MKDKIVELLLQGKTTSQICKELSCAQSTISYHRKKLGKGKNFARYNWEEIAQYQREGHTAKECWEKFGCSASAWEGAIAAGKIQGREVRPFDLFNKASRRKNSRNLKRHILKNDLLEERCYGEGCPVKKEWLGKPITLQLDHIDGDGTNNEISNLRFLCGNCHSQTLTYGGKNRNFYTNKYGETHLTT